MEHCLTNTSLHSDKISTIAKLDGLIKETSCTEILGIVIYDLPGRDCAAKASNGELAVGSLATYKAQYIDRPSFILNYSGHKIDRTRLQPSAKLSLRTLTLLLRS
jgi:cellulose 1,4-beta-cellobiosidase